MYYKKICVLTILIYILSNIFMVSHCENYTWSVTPNISVDVSANADGSATTSNELNLDCGSAILIEQSTRASFI